MARFVKITFYIFIFLLVVAVRSLIYKLLYGSSISSNSFYGSLLEQERVPREMLVREETMDDLIDRMAAILAETLDRFTEKGASGGRVTCINEEVIGNSCELSSCLRLQLPVALRVRVEQLVKPDDLRLEVKWKRTLEQMRRQLPGNYDVMIVSAASSSHYEEARNLIINLHLNVFPYLANSTLVLYNLGLTPDELVNLSEMCRCKIIDFPWDTFPDFFSINQCHAWKPVIIKAHTPQANLIMWLDSSVRFRHDPEGLHHVLATTRELGIQAGRIMASVSHQTLPNTFHFFGDEACAYLPYMSSLTSMIIVHNEEFVQRVILEPWMACALSGKCMCPQGVKNLTDIGSGCHRQHGTYFYGACHRFDQSALNIIGTKLYQELAENVFADEIIALLDVTHGYKTS